MFSHESYTISTCLSKCPWSWYQRNIWWPLIASTDCCSCYSGIDHNVCVAFCQRFHIKPAKFIKCIPSFYGGSIYVFIFIRRSGSMNIFLIVKEKLARRRSQKMQLETATVQYSAIIMIYFVIHGFFVILATISQIFQKF